MKADTISRPLSRALHGIRKHASNTTADSFRHRLALRLHVARLLGPLSLDQVRYLVDRAQLHDYRAGEAVLDSTDAGRYQLLVLQGEVRVQRREPGNGDATDRPVTLQPMDVMGGFALLNAVTRKQRAIAVSDARVLLLDADLADVCVPDQRVELHVLPARLQPVGEGHGQVAAFDAAHHQRARPLVGAPVDVARGTRRL